MSNLAAYGLVSFAYPRNRSDPKGRRSTTLAAKKWTDVRQNFVSQVEYRLERSHSEYPDAETPGQPFGVGQIAQHFRNCFASKLHRTIGHK